MKPPQAFCYKNTVIASFIFMLDLGVPEEVAFGRSTGQHRLRSMPGGRVLLLSSPSGTRPVSVTSATVLSQGEYVNRLSLLSREQHPSQRR